MISGQFVNCDGGNHKAGWQRRPPTHPDMTSPRVRAWLSLRCGIFEPKKRGGALQGGGGLRNKAA
ncbi:MAG: hypothetical protein ACSHWY_13145 [Octadecabacter sp.]